MTDNTLVSTLEATGLTPAEAEILADLIAHGSSAAGSIARRSKLKRGSVYAALNSLVARGLANKSQTAKTLLFTPIPRETILSTLKLEASRQLTQFQNATSALQQLFQEIPEGKERKIDGFELKTITGEKGVYEHLYQSLSKQSFNAIFDPQLLTDVAFQLALKAFKDTRSSKNVIREIARRGPKTQLYKKVVQSEYHKVRIAPENFNILCDCIITTRQVTLISYENTDCNALRITHPAFAALLNSLFESAWSQLS